MRNFFSRVWLCCTKPASYKQWKGKSFWSGFWYLYWLLVVTTFVSAVIFAAQATVFMPKIQAWIREAKQTVPELYPEELVLTFSGAELFTNVEEPYIFPLPAGWEEKFLAYMESDTLKEEERRIDVEHILIIDTDASVEQYDAYGAAVLLTEKAAIARDKSTIKVMLYSDFQKPGAAPIVINKELYTEVTSKALPFLNFIPPIIIGVAICAVLLLPWFAAAIGVMVYLAYLLLFTLLAWGLAAIMRRKFTYSELYKLGFRALTPAILVEWILADIGVTLPLVFSTIFLVMMGLVMKEFPKQGAKAVQAPKKKTKVN